MRLLNRFFKKFRKSNSFYDYASQHIKTVIEAGLGTVLNQEGPEKNREPRTRVNIYVSHELLGLLVAQIYSSTLPTTLFKLINNKPFGKYHVVTIKSVHCVHFKNSSPQATRLSKTEAQNLMIVEEFMEPNENKKSVLTLVDLDFRSKITPVWGFGNTHLSDRDFS